MRQDAAAQVPFDFRVHERREDRRFSGGVDLGQERLPVFLDRLVEHGVLGPVALVLRIRVGGRKGSRAGAWIGHPRSSARGRARGFVEPAPHRRAVVDVTPSTIEPERAAQPGLERPLEAAALDAQEAFALRREVLGQPGAGDAKCELRRAARVGLPVATLVRAKGPRAIFDGAGDRVSVMPGQPQVDRDLGVEP